MLEMSAAPTRMAFAASINTYKYQNHDRVFSLPLIGFVWREFSPNNARFDCHRPRPSNRHGRVKHQTLIDWLITCRSEANRSTYWCTSARSSRIFSMSFLLVSTAICRAVRLLTSSSLARSFGWLSNSLAASVWPAKRISPWFIEIALFDEQGIGNTGHQEQRCIQTQGLISWRFLFLFIFLTDFLKINWLIR